MTILMLDDERTWLNPTDSHVVVRTVDEAIAFVDDMDELDELWLDYILVMDTTEGFVKYLRERAYNGRPLTVGKAFFHSNAFAARELLNMILTPTQIELEYVDPYERSTVMR